MYLLFENDSDLKIRVVVNTLFRLIEKKPLRMNGKEVRGADFI